MQMVRGMGNCDEGDKIKEGLYDWRGARKAGGDAGYAFRLPLTLCMLYLRSPHERADARDVREHSDE